MNTPTAMAAPHFSTIDELDAAKAALRTVARARRAGLDQAAGLAVARHVLALGLVPAGAVVAGVWPLPNELDLRPLWLTLHEAGRRVLLPQTPKRGEALVFRVWTPAAVMVRERFGTLRPEGETAVPDLIFVPLLAFDAQGGRLGYGGGYYDRTLAALPRAAAIGFGHAALQVDKVPMGPHDHRLRRIVTEDGLAVDRA